MEQLASVIVENRKFDNFGENCHNHLKFLPKGTKLFVFTSNDLIKDYKKQLKSFGYTDIVSFNHYNNDIKIPNMFYKLNGFVELLSSNEKIKSLLNYCLLLTSTEFWKVFNKFYRVLTFQMDTGILRTGIEQFYDWDYIGAPCQSFVNDTIIMNGGLSLRNPRTMEYICRYYGWDSDINDLIELGNSSTASFFAEDVFFAYRMIKYNIGKYATMEHAKLFSVESRFNWGSFGYHNPYPYLTEDDVNKLKTQYLKKDLEK